MFIQGKKKREEYHREIKRATLSACVLNPFHFFPFLYFSMILQKKREKVFWVKLTGTDFFLPRFYRRGQAGKSLHLFFFTKRYLTIINTLTG